MTAEAPRSNWLTHASRGFVRFYQLALSPYLGGRCRFQPTCSHYALEALRVHGFFKGWALAVWRLLRCHPFSRGGYDPVPPGREGR
jgi:putative membrane protein insertion efficiency factor